MVKGNTAPSGTCGLAMHRIKVSSLIAVIVLSQILCLVVLSTAIWESRTFQTAVTIGLERGAAGPPPESLQKPQGDPEFVFRGTRILGKSGLISECLSNELRARIRQELTGVELPEPGECWTAGDPE